MTWNSYSRLKYSIDDGIDFEQLQLQFLLQLQLAF